MVDLPKIDNTNLWDKTYMLLKERIVRREFKPNEKLSIPELAARLGVSRTPIRDALNRLEMDGLVKTVSKVGTFVNAIEVEDVLDMIDTRLMLELWVVEKLPTLPKSSRIEKIKRLEDILAQAAVAVREVPLETYLKSDYNLQFHIEFIKLGDNRKNVDIYLGMMNYHFLAVEQSLFTKEMVTSAVDQHYSVVDALQREDYDAVKAAIKMHLDDSKERLIKRIQANGGQI
ncbi:MAG: GntR family transcriptional regulator [Negativicutes bacterium]|nr:GntR family transcriptional regulator [Negativicutes bacterium]